DAARALGQSLEVLVKFADASPEALLKGNQALQQLRREQQQDDQKTKANQREIAKQNLEVELRVIDGVSQQLELRTQILDIQKQTGELSEQQATKQTAQLLQQKIAILGLKQAALERKQADTSNATPAGQSQIVELQQQINQLGLEAFRAKNELYDLTSPLIAARDAFHLIAEAVGQLPGNLANLKG